jgi:hypothetical protein
VIAAATTESHTPRPASPSEEISTPTALDPKPIDHAVLERIRQTIIDLRDSEYSFVSMADLNSHYMTNLPPDLHPEKYGFKSLRLLLLESRIVALRYDRPANMVRLRRRRTTSTVATATEEAPLLPNRFDSTDLKALRTAIANSPRYKGSSFVIARDVRDRLLEQSPDLNRSNYGYSRLRDFVLASGIVEMHKVKISLLVRLWNECELGPAWKDEREFNMRSMMKFNQRIEETTPLKSKVEHEQSRGRDASLAVVASDAEDERRMPLALVGSLYGHDDQGHETRLTLPANAPVLPLESKDDHGEGQETSPASASPTESDVHEHEHQTPLESEVEHKVEHETSSAPASSENIQKHDDEQQGIGMPLTLKFGPEHGDETTPTSNSGPEIGDETSPTSQDDSEQERETSSLSKTDPVPEQPEPEPKPKTTPLSSLAQSFSFSERR